MNRQDSTKCIVSLERVTNNDVISYKVVVTNSRGSVVKGLLNKPFETENYNQALLVAKLLYEELEQRFSRLIVGSYIEQPHCTSCQGALYSESEFAMPNINTDSFYIELRNEFIEGLDKKGFSNPNLIFRMIVSDHKLNLYQERKFLEYLKDYSGLIKSAESNKKNKFDTYREKLLEVYDIDINDFQVKDEGGKVKPGEVTDYDLDQLVMGVEVELEHTDDKMRALQIAMEHLEEISTYYTHLKEMEDKYGDE